MAVGKYQPFVKDGEIYCMNTETGALFRFTEKFEIDTTEVDEGETYEGSRTSYGGWFEFEPLRRPLR